jgi:hypothetical protein
LSTIFTLRPGGHFFKKSRTTTIPTTFFPYNAANLLHLRVDYISASKHQATYLHTGYFKQNITIYLMKNTKVLFHILPVLVVWWLTTDHTGTLASAAPMYFHTETLLTATLYDEVSTSQ